LLQEQRERALNDFKFFATGGFEVYNGRRGTASSVDLDSMVGSISSEEGSFMAAIAPATDMKTSIVHVESKEAFN
jgi:hypothetical protein